MKNFFKNIRGSVSDLVSDIRQKTADFVDNYKMTHESRRENFKEAVASTKNRVKSAFSSAVNAMAEANGRYEYAMARPLDIPTSDHYAQFADAVKKSDKKISDDKKPVITRADITGKFESMVDISDDHNIPDNSELSL